MRSMCFNCPSAQLLSRSSIKSKKTFNVCSIKIEMWLNTWLNLDFSWHSLSNHPEVWKVDISSGHGPKEVKTTWQVSTNPPVEHMTSNNTGKECLWWNEVLKVDTWIKFVFILGSVGLNFYLNFSGKAKWCFVFYWKGEMVFIECKSFRKWGLFCLSPLLCYVFRIKMTEAWEWGRIKHVDWYRNNLPFGVRFATG